MLSSEPDNHSDRGFLDELWEGAQRDGKLHSLRVRLIPPHGMPRWKVSWRRAHRAPRIEPSKSQGGHGFGESGCAA